ncbi:MAG TPA: sugar ABC transporter permease [Solirubrobacteraceae bacterium]|nr:sugar ABC transporter permease [Solirubrobacteraceae bacterium]
MSATTTTASTPSRLSLRERLHRADGRLSPYVYVAPFFAIFGVFGLYPLLYTGYVSLTNRNLLNPGTRWVGLDNYSNLLHDSYFWNAVGNTFGIWVLSTIPQLLMALGLAHVLNTRLRVRTLLRMSILVPQVTSLVAVALIFTQLFDYRYGLFNWLIGLVGVGKVNWEAGDFTSWIALSVMVTWRWTGYNALLYLAAMQSIPDELYEAAEVDGAGRFRQFIHVTIPQIRPTIVFTVIISTIGGLQLFTEPYLFEPLKQGATGGSARQYQTVVMYLYEKAFGSGEFKFGYASAIAWSLFLITIVFSLVNFLFVSRIRSAH